jgi:hypothetical protein
MLYEKRNEDMICIGEREWVRHSIDFECEAIQVMSTSKSGELKAKYWYWKIW